MLLKDVGISQSDRFGHDQEQREILVQQLLRLQLFNLFVQVRVYSKSVLADFESAIDLTLLWLSSESCLPSLRLFCLTGLVSDVTLPRFTGKTALRIFG